MIETDAASRLCRGDRAEHADAGGWSQWKPETRILCSPASSSAPRGHPKVTSGARAGAAGVHGGWGAEHHHPKLPGHWQCLLELRALNTAVPARLSWVQGEVSTGTSAG